MHKDKHEIRTRPEECHTDCLIFTQLGCNIHMNSIRKPTAKPCVSCAQVEAEMDFRVNTLMHFESHTTD